MPQGSDGPLPLSQPALSIFVVHPSALLTDHEPHGDGLVAHGFIRSLAARGHELYVAAPRVALRYPLPPNVHLRVLGWRAGPEPVARLEYMARVRRLYEHLRRRMRFDILHQLNPVDAGLSLAVAGAGAPLVLGPYVPAWPQANPPGLLNANRLTMTCNRLVRAVQERQARVLLLTTPAARAKLAGGPRPDVLVRELPHGIDDRVWSPAPVEPETLRVLFLANLEARKGIYVLLDAFERLASVLPAARLSVAGGGSESGSVRRAVATSPARAQIELLGHVPRSDVPALMRSCAVYCLPSMGEPFGMSALEAMACGRPVVAADAGGLRYLVDDSGGRRVPPGDPGALAQALRELLGAPELRRRMGEHNRRVVETKYAWERVTSRLEMIYDEARNAG